MNSHWQFFNVILNEMKDLDLKRKILRKEMLRMTESYYNCKINVYLFLLIIYNDNRDNILKIQRRRRF